MAQLVKNLPAMHRTWFDPWAGKVPWGKERFPTPVFWPGIFFVSLVAQTVKSLPAMQDPQVQSLGQEDTLEKEMAFHSSILALKIPWM